MFFLRKMQWHRFYFTGLIDLAFMVGNIYQLHTSLRFYGLHVSFDPLSIKASPPPLRKDVYSAGNKAVRKKAKQVFKWCHCVLLCSVSRSQI